MAIQVVCPGCHGRFKVSDNFAGKKGPCPKCKTEITVPKATEEVKIHAPDSFGPKDKQGRAALKPIFREETKFSPFITAVIAAPLAVAFIGAIVAGASIENDTSTMFTMLTVGALLVAPPLVLSGYLLIRDNDLEPYRGQDLWMRIGICSIVFAATWAFLTFVNWYVYESDGFSFAMMFVFAALMIGAGTMAASFSLELETVSGGVVYCLYFVVTILLRWMATGTPFPLAEA